MSRATGWNLDQVRALILGFLVLPCSVVSFAQDPPANPEPTAKEEPGNVLKELQVTLIEAVGGREALEKHGNRRMVAKVLIPDAAIEAKHVGFVSRKGTMWESMTIEGYGDFQQGFHGDVAWSMDPINGPRILDGVEKEQLRRSSHLQPLLWFDKDYVFASMSGTEKIGDMDCNVYKLKTTMDSEETYWIDAKTNFIIQVALTVESIMGKIPMRIHMGDYKQLEGIWYPHALEIQQGIQKIQMSIENLEYDVEPESAEKTVPAPVQTLVDRKKESKEKEQKPEETESKPSGR